MFQYENFPTYLQNFPTYLQKLSHIFTKPIPYTLLLYCPQRLSCQYDRILLLCLLFQAIIVFVIGFESWL